MSRWSLAGVIGCVLVLFGGAVAFYERAPEKASESVSVVELQVSNLTCGSCVGRIEQALNKLEGVGEISVDLASGTARIVYDAAHVEPETIAATIGNAGYPATLAAAQAGARTKVNPVNAACPGCKPVVKKGCGGCCG